MMVADDPSAHLCLFSVKVSFVLYDYFPFGGLQEDCLLTARAMQARGHEVKVVTRTWAGGASEIPKDLDVHLMGRKGGTNTARNVHFFADLKRYFSENPQNAVVAFNRIPECDFYFSADPCYLEKVKDKPFWYFWTGRHRHYRDCEAALFKSATRPQIYTLTEREIDVYCHYYDTPRDRFHLLPPGVARVTRSAEDKTRIRSELRTEAGTSADCPVALFVGSDYKRKGLMRNLEAIKHVKAQGQAIEFWVLGADNDKTYRAYAEEYDLPVKFFGGRSDADRFFDSADFLIHPAHSESAGKVLLEALTHGLPVIVSGACGYSKQVGESGGGIVLDEPFAQESLNQAVFSLASDEGVRSELSEKAVMYSERENIYDCPDTFASRIESEHQGSV